MESKNTMNEIPGNDIQVPLQDTFVQQVIEPSEKRKLKDKGSLIALIGGMVSGLLSFIFGIIMYTMPTGYWESNEKYGGDAYTGIQNAAAQTANNVQDLAQIAQQGFAFILMAAGLIALFAFASKLFKKENNG